MWGIVNLWNNFPAFLPESTPTFTPTLTPAFAATKTNSPATVIPSETPIPTLPMGSSMNGKDGMTLLYVPAGEFTMGSDTGDEAEKPVHQVYLDAFWIDKTEVTNKMYSSCVEAGVCEELPDKSSHIHSNYYGNAKYDNYPVIHVDWNMAKTYCEWVDRRLPTEAEWEKAARGVDGRIYPWGNGAPSASLLNFNNKAGDTTEVGAYPDGASPYGALDMAGNVWEWVADWFSDTYYASSPKSNPLGPDSGEFRALRSGSWYWGEHYVRTAFRNRVDPTGQDLNIGFRCAMNVIP